MFELFLFGEPHLRTGSAGADAPPPRRQTITLLGLLAIASATGMRRERLASLLWPDRDEEHARASLRQALTASRRVLEGTSLTLVAGTSMVQLEGEASSVDVRAFEPEATGLIERSGPPERFARVVALYRDELMPGHLCPRPAEEAIAAARERMHQIALRLVEAYSRLTNPARPARPSPASFSRPIPWPRRRTAL